MGEAGVEHPDFWPEGTALFEIDGSRLTLTLTYLDSNETVVGLNQALSGLTWNINPVDGIPDLVSGGTVGLIPLSAMIPSGLGLVGVNASNFSGVTDLSTEWAFKDQLNSTVLGDFGVSAVGGDRMWVGDGWGPKDLFNPTGTPLQPPSPNGGDFMIVPDDVNLTLDGFKSKGPMVQNSMVFEFTINSSLSPHQIVDVTPIFGTAGAPPIPEPHSALLFTIGGLIVGGAVRRARSA